MTASALGRARQHANVGLAACRQRSVKARDKCVQRGSSHARRGGASPASCGRVVRGPAHPSARLEAGRLETYRRRAARAEEEKARGGRRGRRERGRTRRLGCVWRPVALALSHARLYFPMSLSGIWVDEWHWEYAVQSRGTCLRESDDSQLEHSKLEKEPAAGKQFRLQVRPRSSG
jgi:hypothetical protein